MTTAAPESGGIKASPTPRTTAHGHKRLAAVLGWTVTQVDKAVILGGLSLSRLHRGRALADEQGAGSPMLSSS